MLSPCCPPRQSSPMQRTEAFMDERSLVGHRVVRRARSWPLAIPARALSLAMAIACLPGCAAERGVVARRPTVLLLRVSADVQEPTGRKIAATAFFTPPGASAQPVVLARSEFDVDIGQTELPFTVDITLCLGDVSSGVAGKTCPLSL